MGKIVELKEGVQEVKENKAANQPPKLDYDKLKEICNGLANENHALREQLMQRGYAEAIKRIDFLFKALEFKELFSKEFIDFAIEEIQSALTPPEESKVESESAE